MATPEKAIENGILEYLNTLSDGFFWKNNSVGVYDPVKKIYRKSRNKFAINGVSDILGCWRGKFVAIEVKSKRGRLTDGQQSFLMRIQENGGIAFVARGVNEVKEKLKCEAAK